MESSAAGPSQGGWKTFLTIWAGQLVSLLGSGLSGFALGLWVLSRSGSVTKFALIALCTLAPRILLSPLAGAVADRWDRRSTMLASELGAALVTGWMALMLMAGRLTPGGIYLAMSAISVCSAFQWPAWAASITLLVPKDQFARASGMVQIAQGLAQTLAPVMAGIMLQARPGIVGILWIDFSSYIFAAIILLLVRIPRPAVVSDERPETAVVAARHRIRVDISSQSARSHRARAHGFGVQFRAGHHHDSRRAAGAFLRFASGARYGDDVRRRRHVCWQRHHGGFRRAAAARPRYGRFSRPRRRCSARCGITSLSRADSRRRVYLPPFGPRREWMHAGHSAVQSGSRCTRPRFRFYRYGCGRGNACRLPRFRSARRSFLRAVVRCKAGCWRIPPDGGSASDQDAVSRRCSFSPVCC